MSAALEGKILAPGDGAFVVYSPSPFRRGTVGLVALPAGGTIADAVAIVRATHRLGPKLERHLGVYLGDQRIPRKVWSRVRPKPGVSLYIRVELSGGSGSGKNPLRALLMIAVVVVASIFAPVLGGVISGLGIPANFANAIAQIALVTAGQALVNALIPPPKVNQNYGFDQQPGNPYASVTGIRNRYNLYGYVPRIIGKRRLYPVLAAHPYTESQGNKQYLRMLLLVGHGPLEITDIRIGNTPITSFPGSTYEVREGWDNDTPVTLYTNTISQEELAIELEAGSPGAWHERTSAAGATELSVDITFPFGLVDIDEDNGSRDGRQVQFDVEWSVAGAGVWVDAEWIDGKSEHGTNVDGVITAKAASTDPQIRSGRFAVTGGSQYDVRIRRTTAAASASAQITDDAYWTVLRSITQANPVRAGGMALIALRLKATSELNGAPDTISCIAHSYLPVLSSGAWSYQLSRSPSWGAVDLLRRRGQASMIPDQRIDLDAWKAFATGAAATAPNAAEPYWQADIVLDGGSVVSTANLVAASGRAQLALVDGRYAPVRDVTQTTPVQHITPRNSWGYRGSKAFVDIPHAFRTTFYNPNKQYAQDEVIVYRPGYAETAGGGNLAATKFETLDLPACTSATQAWREAQYHFAVLLYRAEEHTVNMDVENLRCSKGSLVQFSHDVIRVGQVSGRLIAAETDGASAVTGLVLDQEVEMEAGKSYGVRVRHRDMTSTVYPVTLQVGMTDRVALSSPAAADDIHEGAIYSFGEAGAESAPMIVKEIRPGPDLTARLTLVDAPAAVWSADQGAIPSITSLITDGLDPTQVSPTTPVITVRSDEEVVVRTTDGTLIDRIEITHAQPGGSMVTIGAWQAEWKRYDTTEEWTPAGMAPYGTPLFIAPVAAGEAYDVRARFISTSGAVSEWDTVTNHTVVGKTTPPEPPSGFTVTAGLDSVKLAWTASPSIDVSHYEIRYGGANWAASTLLGNELGVLRTELFALSGATTFRIKAVDVVGLYSTEVTATSPAANTAGVGATADTLDDLKPGAEDIIDALAAGTLLAGGGEASNAGVVTDSAGTWQTVAYVDVAVPAGGFVYFPNVYATFQPDGGTVLTKAGVKIVESTTGGGGPSDLLTLSPTVNTSIGATTDWEAPAAWATNATQPATRNATRRFTLQVRRDAGDGTIAINAAGAHFAAAVW